MCMAIVRLFLQGWGSPTLQIASDGCAAMPSADHAFARLRSRSQVLRKQEFEATDNRALSRKSKSTPHLRQGHNSTKKKEKKTLQRCRQGPTDDGGEDEDKKEKSSGKVVDAGPVRSESTKRCPMVKMHQQPVEPARQHIAHNVERPPVPTRKKLQLQMESGLMPAPPEP